MGFIRNFEVWNNQIPKVCNYDICEYITYGVIGTGTTEQNCDDFADLRGTAIESRNSFIRSLKDYLLSTTLCVSDETCETIYQQKIYEDFFGGVYLEYQIKFNLFWNMFECDPLIGVQTESIQIPTYGGGSYLHEYDIDYGNGEFDILIVEEYQQMSIDFMCAIKNIMVLVMGETFDQSSMTNFQQITYP